MPGMPQQITFTLTGEQNEKLEALKKLTGNDTTNVFREALELYYEKMMEDEEIKELAKINSLLNM